METTVKLKEQIGKFNPCRESVVWMGDRTLAQAWDDCERGDWLLWLCAKAGVDKKKIVLAACGCARLVLHLVAEDEPRPRLAIETAEAWCRGEATIHDVKAAYAAAYAASAYAAYADAAYAAAYAAYAAYAGADAAAAYAAFADAAYADAAYAAYADAAFADAATYAAYADADADARRIMQRKCGEVVREFITARDVGHALTGN